MGAPARRWPFFTSHPEPHLAAAAGSGRIEEFATYGWDTAEMLDPQDPLAFQTAKLNWSELAGVRTQRHADALPPADRAAADRA